MTVFLKIIWEEQNPGLKRWLSQWCTPPASTMTWVQVPSNHTKYQGWWCTSGEQIQGNPCLGLLASYVCLHQLAQDSKRTMPQTNIVERTHAINLCPLHMYTCTAHINTHTHWTQCSWFLQLSKLLISCEHQMRRYMWCCPGTQSNVHLIWLN